MRIDKYKAQVSHLDFIDRYGTAPNAASASEVDPNANVEQKNIAT